MNRPVVRFYDTLKQQKVPFEPTDPNNVKIYSCGPTVYDFLHVGNARAFVVGDLFHRTLEALGYPVTFATNFTDVDDKIIKRAEKENRSAMEVAEQFTHEVLVDMKNLNLRKPDLQPKVTETMEEIIQVIEELIQGGHAYEVDGEVLYHVPSFSEYGKLSKRKLEEQQHGIRVEVEAHKKSPNDFVLWKPAKTGEISWPSPWGKGRPGWHIECSAMIRKHLGNTIDLHHGGIDLIFPHHENEIAQSEACNHAPLSQVWCHNHFINFGAEKMSKSLGNLVTIRDFCQKYSGEILRMIMVSSHYRTQIDWSDEVIERASSELERIHTFLQERKEIVMVAPSTQMGPFASIYESIVEYLADDLNTPGALAELFKLIRQVRRDFPEMKKGSPEALGVGNIFYLIQEALGIIYDADSLLKKLQHRNSDSLVVEKLIEERIKAKQNKNWARADEIRQELKNLKVVLQDHPDGSTTWSHE